MTLLKGPKNPDEFGAIPIDAPKPWKQRWKETRENWKLGYYKSRFVLASHKKGNLLLLQCVSAFAILYGISYYSVPVALIVGGVGGILAAERQ